MRLTRIEGEKVMEEALMWRPPTCNLCCCPLCGGDGLSPTCYICIYPAFGRLTLNSGHCSIPLMEIPIGYLIFSSCFHCFVWVFIVCPYFICLSFAVVSDWHQELISLLWTWQDVLSLGLISHHACDDNFLFPCSSSARLKLFSQICACISGTLWTLLHARKK